MWSCDLRRLTSVNTDHLGDSSHLCGPNAKKVIRCQQKLCTNCKKNNIQCYFLSQGNNKNLVLWRRMCHKKEDHTHTHTRARSSISPGKQSEGGEVSGTESRHTLRSRWTEKLPLRQGHTLQTRAHVNRDPGRVTRRHQQNTSRCVSASLSGIAARSRGRGVRGRSRPPSRAQSVNPFRAEPPSFHSVSVPTLHTLLKKA